MEIVKMGTKRQHKFPYVINYDNSSHMLLELKQEEFKKLADAVTYNRPGVVIEDIGLVMTSGIRSIIKQKPQPKPKQEEGALPDGLTAEDVAWLAANKHAWTSLEDAEEFTQ
jgi:hypothetical protein